MADDTTTVEERVVQLLDELDPTVVPVEEFRGRQYDLGLAWISFPEGLGGLGLAPNLQRIVDRRLSEAGATGAGAREFFGLTMAGPTVVTTGRTSCARACSGAPSRERVRGASCSASLVPAPTWPAWPPGPCGTAMSG